MAYPTTIPVRLFKQGEYAVINGEKYVLERTTPADKMLCEHCGYSIVYQDDDGEVCAFEYCTHCGSKVIE